MKILKFLGRISKKIDELIWDKVDRLGPRKRLTVFVLMVESVIGIYSYLLAKFLLSQYIPFLAGALGSAIAFNLYLARILSRESKKLPLAKGPL